MTKKDRWLKELKETKFIDLTDIKKDDRQHWVYLFTKMHPKTKFCHEWIEDRFLMYPVTDVTESVFVFYQSMFVFHAQAGKIAMLIGKYFNDSDKKNMKEKLHYEKGNAIVLLPEPRSRNVRFQLFPMNELQIEKVKPHTNYEEKSVKDQIMRAIETKTREIQSLTKELDEHFTSIKIEKVIE